MPNNLNPDKFTAGQAGLAESSNNFAELSSFGRGSQPKLCGILNLTPDSFSDGGLYLDPSAALRQARALKASGAELLDLGAESTRPGSSELSSQEELERLLPVIQLIKSELDLPFSVDTYRAETAAAALAAGALMINDITGLFGDPEMASVLAESGAGLILMFNPTILRPWHQASKNFRRFAPEDSFTKAEIEHAKTLNIEDQMLFFFAKALNIAERAGIKKERIWLDPGIGFGLSAAENLRLLDAVSLIHELGYAAYYGVSRKRFLAGILAEGNCSSELSGIDARDLATASVTSFLAAEGVELLRVHNVELNYPALLLGREVALSREKRQAAPGISKLAQEGEDKIYGRYE